MAKAKKSASQDRKPPGPPADYLKLEGPWEKAVAYALSRGRPEEPPPELPTATCPKCGAAVEADPKHWPPKLEGHHATVVFLCPNKHSFSQRVHLK